MKLIKQIAITMMALGLAACASHTTTTGTKIDPSQLAQFQKGKTTYSDVVQAVGPPNTTTTLPDGSRIASYRYATAQVSGSHIPLVGGSGSVNTQSSTVTFSFMPNGVLKDYSSTQAGSGTTQVN